MTRFDSGDVIQRREVLHGEVWPTQPVRVVHDDGEHLAVRLDPGSAFTFPPHAFGLHPWAHQSAWGDSIVLQLYRTRDLYSAWKIFEHDGTFRHWYINFEAPVVRGSGHIDTEDYGLDLIIEDDGRREWKDVTDLHHQQVEGRTSAQTALTVLAAAAEVEADLDAGDLWWSGWNDWTPS